MANEVTTTEGKKNLLLAATKIADVYISDVTNLNAAVGVPMNDESKRCAVNAILSLCGDLGAESVKALPKEQLVQVLQFVTINGLDAMSGQVFIDKRWNGKEKRYDIKATPMGNAYEIMVKRYGVDVKTIHQAKIVHEGDEFTLPQFDGLNTTNIVFKPTLKGLDGKAIAIYYIIEKQDGTLDYAISTREGVAKNLMAQILNATLRNESINRNELMKKMEGKSLDELLSDPSLAEYVSPAYRSPATREQMIITKMKKNALLHYTRDLGAKAFASEAVSKAISADENSDMVMPTNVVAVDDGEAPKQAPTKIENFDVDDDGVVEEKPQNQPQKPVKNEKAEAVVVEEEPAKKAAKQTADTYVPKEVPPVQNTFVEAKKDDTVDVFGIDDL